MKLSTRSTYGIRALVELALAEGQGPLSASSIAQRQDLSVAYLEQLLHKLKKGGLVRSIRGPRGGYALARPAAEITMADAVRLLETDGFALRGAQGGVDGSGEGALPLVLEAGARASQVTQAVWHCVHERLLSVLSLVSLRDVCDAAAKPSSEPLENRYAHT
jgi:Rrf2 family protein